MSMRAAAVKNMFFCLAKPETFSEGGIHLEAFSRPRLDACQKSQMPDDSGHFYLMETITSRKYVDKCCKINCCCRTTDRGVCAGGHSGDVPADKITAAAISASVIRSKWQINFCFAEDVDAINIIF